MAKIPSVAFIIIGTLVIIISLLSDMLLDTNLLAFVFIGALFIIIGIVRALTHKAKRVKQHLKKLKREAHHETHHKQHQSQPHQIEHKSHETEHVGRLKQQHYYTCPNCGRYVRWRDNICEHCGELLRNS